MDQKLRQYSVNGVLVKFLLSLSCSCDQQGSFVAIVFSLQYVLKHFCRFELYGPIVCIWFGTTPYVVVKDPAVIKVYFFGLVYFVHAFKQMYVFVRPTAQLCAVNISLSFLNIWSFFM